MTKSDMEAKDVLTPRQRQAVTAMCNSRSMEEAAKRAGISERTLYRWMHQEPFLAAVRKAQSEAIGDMAREFLSIRFVVINGLTKLAIQAESEAVQLRALQVIGDFIIRLHDATATSERIRALEERVFSDGRKL